MPHLKSAKKRLRQNQRRAARNRSAMSAIRTQIRRVREAAAAKDGKAREALNALYRILDKAADRGILHKNAAARKKSRLAAVVAAAEANPAVPAKP